MIAENGRLVLGEAPCWSCGASGEQPETERVPCPTCKGTGRGVRGGRDGCKKCRGLRYSWERTGGTELCSQCDGLGLKPEDYYDRITDDVWRSLEFRVHRSQRCQTFTEAYIGAGCWSVTDYGDANTLTDEEVITKVRENSLSGVQACKVIREPGSVYRGIEPDPRLPDYVGIFIHRSGYTVAAVFGEEVKA